MRGISEELLKATYQALLNDFRARPNDSGIKACLEGLMARCTELNQWLPIENAPKDEREILLFVPGCHGCEIGRWNINADSWSCYPYEPTHYQELPDDPKE